MSIAADFTAFKNALMSEKTKVTADNSGNWHKMHPIEGLFTQLAYFEKSRWCSLAINMVKELDRQEKIPVRFNDRCDQAKMFNEYLEASKHMITQMKVFSTSRKIQKLRNALQQRMIAMQYRIEQVNGGLDKTDETSVNLKDLEQLAVDWKEKYPLYQNTSISESEKAKLQQAAHYPAFVKLVELDSVTRNQFFRWVIRDNNSVRAFIQFPSTCKRLKTALLSGRVGRFANDFKFINKEKGEKVFSLPFHVEEGGRLKTRMISILDESCPVTLRGNYIRTIGQIMEIFKSKNLLPGNLELMGANGIANWNTHELGWWNPEEKYYQKINLDEENGHWWKQLPIFESLTLDDVRSRYGVECMQQDQWLAVAKSTRESLHLDIDRSHGYFEILVPDEKIGLYNLYPMGKFAKDFPQNIIEKFLLVCGTVKGSIVYPDENPFYSHRQQASAPLVIEKEKGYELMEMIRKDLKSAREGNIVFQFAWENCAWWPQKRLEALFENENPSKVPNFFVSFLNKAYPSAQPLKFIFGSLRLLSRRIQNVGIRIIAFILGSWRGVWVEENRKRVFKSTKNSEFYKKCSMYHPAMLHSRIQNGTIKGKVTFGHHFLPQLEN